MKENNSNKDTVAKPLPFSLVDTEVLTGRTNEIKLPQIPGYNVMRLLGTGGMASVYLAEDLNLKRPVALKMMSEQLSSDDQFRKRFESEGQIVAGFRHSNIVTVYASGEVDSKRYIAMEYVPGGTLSERLSTERIDEKEAIQIAQQIAEALSYSHRHGIIHRDLKPGNILFTNEGQPILSDFGIAKSTISNITKTTTGQVIGSPQYMAPEQLLGKKVTANVDIYSLGILLYEMLMGRKPPQDLSIMRSKEDIKKFLKTFSIDSHIYGAFIAECLNMNPDQRPSADQCSATLKTFCNKTSARLSRRHVIYLSIVGLILLGMFTFTQNFNPEDNIKPQSVPELIQVDFDLQPAAAAIYIDGKRLQQSTLKLAKGKHQTLVIDRAYYGRHLFIDPSVSTQFSIHLERLSVPSFNEFSEFHSRFSKETSLSEVHHENLTYRPYKTLIELRANYLQDQKTAITEKVQQLRALAEFGDPASQLILFLAKDENLIAENTEQTVEWLKQASVAGYALATYYYALHYRAIQEVDNMLNPSSLTVFRDLMTMSHRQGLDFADRFVREANQLLQKSDI